MIKLRYQAILAIIKEQHSSERVMKPMETSEQMEPLLLES